jgi:hypothetical protein
MATLKQIIDEARKLPVEEQRRLRAALEMLELNGDGQSVNQGSSPGESGSPHVKIEDDEIRKLRMDWLKAHRDEYGGQYVALDGNQLIAVGPNYHVAREKALAAGVASAFVTYLSKPDEIADMGGWA